MASVWVARMLGKHGFEKLVAIKTILPQYAEDSRFQKMFLDEAHIASGIEHINAAQILDLGEQHDVLYLVMEYVDGDSMSKLQRSVEKKGLSVPTGIVMRLLADTCAGLHAAHELRDRDGVLLNVVHRDVSPQNILVSARGIAKLIDFGVAKARDRVSGDTNTGMLKGKIQYMAPEQAVGKPIDRRADVWAIGAIAYHFLAGRPAYDGPNQLATLHRLTSGKPPNPLPDEIPKPIAEVVMRSLAFDVDERVATAQDLQQAIESAMVASGLQTSVADVASFLRQHTADRAETRKKAIEVAVAAAAERARVAKALEIDEDSSSGFTRLPKRSSASRGGYEPVPTAPGLDSFDLPRLSDLPAPEASSATINASIDTIDTPPPKRNPRTVAIVAGTTIAAALLLVFAIGRTSGPNANRTEERGAAVERPAAEPTPTTAVLPPPPAPTAAATDESPAPTSVPAPSASAPADRPATAWKPTPKVTKTPPPTPPAPTPQVIAPTPTPPEPTPTVKKKKVDDGF
jgi:serine/threonine-protein kinase